MRMYDIIENKRNGKELAGEEIEFFCKGLYRRQNSRLSGVRILYGGLF